MAWAWHPEENGQETWTDWSQAIEETLTKAGITYRVYDAPTAARGADKVAQFADNFVRAYRSVNPK